MRLCKGQRIRLASTGDPAPHHFVQQSGTAFNWGVNDRILGTAMSDDAAVAATWRRFRQHALVPEAGSLILAISKDSSGMEYVRLHCRGGTVDYPTRLLESGWEVDDDFRPLERERPGAQV